VLLQQGRFHQALGCYEQALAIKKAAYGDAHPEVAATRGNLAAVLARLGRRDEALWHREQELRIKVGALGDDHPDTATTRLNMGVLLGELGRRAEAREQVSRALGLNPEVCGVPFGSDASKLSRQGIPSLVFGPGSIDQAHAATEFVEIHEVEKALEFYRNFILRFH
jgi:tetratricopeptide (TPR) repeat protein